jgi:hypothetical protein
MAADDRTPSAVYALKQRLEALESEIMQCGPVRYRVDARKQAAVRPFAHKVVFRSTAFAAAEPATAGSARIQALYGLMAKDSARNDARNPH